MLGAHPDGSTQRIIALSKLCKMSACTVYLDAVHSGFPTPFRIAEEDLAGMSHRSTTIGALTGLYASLQIEALMKCVFAYALLSP